MDGRGRATDDIWIERFWRTIKRGYVYLHPTQNGIELHKGLKDILITITSKEDIQSLMVNHQTIHIMTNKKKKFVKSNIIVLIDLTY